MEARETPHYSPLRPFPWKLVKGGGGGVSYGKVSPWSETVSGVSAGLGLPVSGEGRRQGERDLATYVCMCIIHIHIYIHTYVYIYKSPPSPPSDLILFQQNISPPLLPPSLLPPPSPGWSAEMRLCALIPSRALKQNPAPCSRRRLGAPGRWSAAGRSEAGYRGAGRRHPRKLRWEINLHHFAGDPRESRKARLQDLRAAASACCNFTFCLPSLLFFFLCSFVLSFWNRFPAAWLNFWRAMDLL